jgi:predicted DNA-binding protein with PD1-like motif
MTAVATTGRFGRLLTVRVCPNLDLAHGIETLCADHGVRHAEIRAAVGSLTDAVLVTANGRRAIAGPGLEIALTAGRVAPDEAGRPRAQLYGIVSDSQGRPYGGEFARGENPVFVTLELVLQEWLPEPQAT